MGTGFQQPATEAVLMTPLQKRREGDEIVVEVLDEDLRTVELKRFKDHTS